MHPRTKKIFYILANDINRQWNKWSLEQIFLRINHRWNKISSFWMMGVN